MTDHKRINFEIHHPELVTVQEFRPGSYLGQHIHPPASLPECKLTQDIPQSEGQSATGHYLISIKTIHQGISQLLAGKRWLKDYWGASRFLSLPFVP